MTAVRPLAMLMRGKQSSTNGGRRLQRG